MANEDFPEERSHHKGLPFPNVDINQSVRITARVLHEGQIHLASNCVLVPAGQSSRAYYIDRDIRDALFGRVYHALVLRRYTESLDSGGGNIDWETTGEACAIKEMDWGEIRKGKRADDPIEEIKAMQYIRNRLQLDGDGESEYVIHPVEILSDERYLFLVTPFCDGGEMFDIMEDEGRFNEADARTMLRQILRGIASLQLVGICHRDISLENILLHNGKCVIIDLGMCLLIPYRTMENDDGIFVNNGGPVGPRVVGDVIQERLLLAPERSRGKYFYMSPEIYNEEPFDGFAVDLWAVGVILFIMVTGRRPWNRPSLIDEQFMYMANQGLMVELLESRELGLSPEVMDLLQNMLYEDPTRRFCLQQVLNHPWFNEG